MMNAQAIRQHGRAVAIAGFLAFAIVSSAVVGRSASTPVPNINRPAESISVQDKLADDALDYKLFLHQQASGAAR
jgi:hypothetical protein